MAQSEPDRSEASEGPGTSESAPKEKKPSWIDNLAQRSTGLPGPGRSSSPSSSPSGNDEVSVWQWAGVGLQFAASVAIFLLIGRWIDNKFGWSYAATLTLLAVALIGNFYLLIKLATRNNK
ncbi:MAG TPA: AtpZ/AtpI family protein [Phycisphaerae bacterium]|nr:AtpZ/AtpI family protein [Phycisphaerae bacterium]